MTVNPPERLYDVAEVGTHLHCGRTQVFALFADGALKSIKVGRRRLVPESSLVAYLESIKAAA